MLLSQLPLSRRRLKSLLKVTMKRLKRNLLERILLISYPQPNSFSQTSRPTSLTLETRRLQRV
jgi:hypothetical protein